MFGASAVRIGCNPYVELPCDGLAQYRMGLSVGHGALLGAAGIGPAVMFHVASRPFDELMVSQAIVTAGVHRKIGRGWVQAGFGVAAQGESRNPKPMSTTAVVGDAVPAMSTGVGIDFGDARAPTSFALDIASSLETSGLARIYQWTASVVHRF